MLQKSSSKYINLKLATKIVLDDSDLEDFYSNDFLDDSDRDESESDSN